MAEIDPNAVQVEAVGIAFAHSSAGEILRAKSESAMRKVVEDAQAEGIGDPDIIRARVLAARDFVIGSV
jgi:hypothetical protein